MKPDLLGYDKVDVNEIVVNPEEAKTDQLIFMMYLAGYDPTVIAKVLTLLGRKTHTHVCKDGHITGGEVKWSRSTVLNVMRNERRMGAVLAQKTVTTDFIEHKSIANDGRLPQFWAVDQHEAIIAEQDYRTADRIMKANYGGWKDGLQTLRVHDSGALAGFVSVCPRWRGFDSEDYNRAALRASGICEEDLDDYEILLQKKIEERNGVKQSEVENLQHRYYVNPGDFDMFKMDESVEPEEVEEEPLPDFKMWVDSIREQKNRTADKFSFGKYDLSDAEVIRPEFLSVTDKPSITLDIKGITFSRSCEKKLDEDFVENVEMYYHPIEQVLLVRKAAKPSTATMRWAKEKDGVTTMRRCGCAGITECIYNNMKWIGEYKYRIVGTRMMIADETMLVFSLENNQMIVPAVPDSVQNLDTDTLSKNVTKNLLRDGFTLESELPDLDDFELGNGPMATAAKKMARSRAIYFDKMLQDNNGSVSVEKLGEKKYDPECIQHMIEKGITPDEGWVYLKGMAVFRKNSFTIYPSEWSDSFGNKFYENVGCRIQDAQRRIQFEPIEEGIEYGWPLGLDLPTREVVLSAITELLPEADNQEEQWTAESLLEAALS